MEAGDRVCVCNPGSDDCLEGEVVAVGHNDVVVMINGQRQTVPKAWVRPVEQGC
jgi:hypothetical protein